MTRITNMTRNTIGGKGHKKSKKLTVTSKHVPFCDNETCYAYILEALGAGRMRVHCFGDGKERIAKIRGSLYKKVWIAKDDLVLVSLRDFQDACCDIVHKYDNDDIHVLVSCGQLPKMYKNAIKRENCDTAESDVLFEEPSQIDIDDI